MMSSVILAAAIALAATGLLAGLASLFDRFAPARFVSERHDLALAGFLLLPIVFALALQPASEPPTPREQLATPVFDSGTEPQSDAREAARAAVEPARQRFEVSLPRPSLLQRVGEIADLVPWASLAVSLWLIGSTIALARLVLDLLGLSLLRWNSRPIGLPAGLDLSRQVQLRLSTHAITPMLCGYFRPAIILPADFRFDEHALPVLEHEVAHLERGDAWTVLATRWLMVVFWWAAPLYLLDSMISRNRETLCDQRAAIITNSPIQLAHALLDAASRSRQAPALALAATPRKSALESRIRHLSSPDATQKRTTVMRLALILPLLASAALIATPHVGAVTHSHDRDHYDRDDADLPLYRAASNGRIDRVRELLDGGADVNAISDGDGTALMAAIYSGHDDIARELVARGADPDIIALGDGTALIAAAHEGEDGVVNLLLEAGADPNLGAAGDGTPLIAAARFGNPRTVNLLLEAGADVNAALAGDGNPLIGASQMGQVEIARMLIDAGADLNGYVYHDETPLINAAQQGEIEVAELLVANGADLSLTVRATDRYGNEIWRSPLSEAQRLNRRDMVRWLEARGATHNPPSE